MHQLSQGGGGGGGGGVSGTNVLGSRPSPAGGGGGGVFIPSYFGHGGSLPLHTQWLKTYAREHLPTYTLVKNVGLPGVSGGEGWEPRAGDPWACLSWRRKCTSNLEGMNRCTWSLICQAPGAAHPLAAPGLMLLNGPPKHWPSVLIFTAGVSSPQDWTPE